MLAALLMSMGLLLNGCDNADKTSNATTQTAQGHEAASTEQAEVEKYNAYVDAANFHADFGEMLETRLKTYPPLFAAGKKLTNYDMVSNLDISIMQDKLQTALAMSYAMPELDAPAKGMLDALKKLQPIQSELAGYADAKGYLADDGKKAKDMEPALDDALKNVAVFQAQFYDGIHKRDEINTRTAFENAEKGSLEYYRAGIIVYAKESARLSDAFFETSGSEDSIKPFNESLNKTAEMIEGWTKKGLEQTPPMGCSLLKSQLNGFVGTAREAIAKARSGAYKRGNQDDAIWKVMNPAGRDADRLQDNYSRMIDGLNRNHCI